MTQITIDRALVEQALEALEWISDCYVGDDDDAGECASCHQRSYMPHAPDCKKNNAITNLRAALAQPAPEPETCTWHQDGDSDSGLYGTSCGHYFNLEDGTPEDNKMAHCCYCGKKLMQELITEDGDD